MEKYDLIIVGAGPAGIFTAVELLRRGSKKHIQMCIRDSPGKGKINNDAAWVGCFCALPTFAA